MIEKFKEVLMNYVEAEEIKDTDDFRKDLGLASFDAVCMASDIRKTLGVSVEASDFLRYPSVKSFWAHISSQL